MFQASVGTSTEKWSSTFSGQQARWVMPSRSICGPDVADGGLIQQPGQMQGVPSHGEGEHGPAPTQPEEEGVSGL